MKSSFFLICTEHLFLSFRHFEDITLKIFSQRVDEPGIESTNETDFKVFTNLKSLLFKIKCHLLLVVSHFFKLFSTLNSVKVFLNKCHFIKRSFMFKFSFSLSFKSSTRLTNFWYFGNELVKKQSFDNFPNVDSS